MRASALLLILAPVFALAQSLDPRAYANAPVGLNFLIAGYAYSSGGVGFDPSVPLENGHARVNAVPLAYVRSLDVFGNAGNVGLVLPFANLSGSATFNGVEQQRTLTGVADPAVRFAVNFYGAPALSAEQFKAYRQDLIIGASVVVTAPLGDYDSNRVANLGANRWSAKPEPGLSKAFDVWTAELSAGATFYTRNDDYIQGNVREQDPLYSAQLHLTRQFGRGMWGAISTTYYEGGRTTLNGVPRDDRLSGSRVGLTFAFPLVRQQSLKLYASTGVHARTGTDFDTVGVAWQYLWGGGL
ncbi:MAG TPA: transporter [Burkholderiales bacterium]|nr:transporter [Burkholderiales bacterium]